MKEYTCTFRISGFASFSVSANSFEEARKKAEDTDMNEGTEQLIEWDYEDITEIEEDE